MAQTSDTGMHLYKLLDLHMVACALQNSIEREKEGDGKQHDGV